MKITIKESMLIRKCLGNYVSSQLLDYDKSPMFNDLMLRLKDFEKRQYNCFEKPQKQCLKILNRKALNKELKKYNYQTICNKKVLNMIEEENKWNIAIRKINNNITLTNK